MILLSGSLVLPFASTQHIFHSPVLGTCFVCRLLFWRDYVYLGQLCLSKGVLCVLIHKSYVRSVERYCFVRKCVAVRVQYYYYYYYYYYCHNVSVFCEKLFAWAVDTKLMDIRLQNYIFRKHYSLFVFTVHTKIFMNIILTPYSQSSSRQSI